MTVRVRGSLVGLFWVAALAVAAAAGCDARPAQSGPPLAPDAGEASACAQLHRDLSRWQGQETSECGPDLSNVIEIAAVGNHRLLVHKRYAAFDDVWQLSPEGVVEGPPTEVAPVKGSRDAALARLPGEPARVFFYSPRNPQYTLYRVQESAVAHETVLVSGEPGVWPPAGSQSLNEAPLGHRFTGLENGYLLDCDLGTGVARAWRFVIGSNGKADLRVPADAALAPAAPHLGCRRGHRLVSLGGDQLLEWTPRVCAGPPDRPVPGCTGGSDFQVWRYTTSEDPAGPHLRFADAPTWSGFWPDIAATDDLFSDETHLFVWRRSTGELRAHPLVPDAADPLSPAPRPSPPQARLRGIDWDPPTQSPTLKHLVIVLQDGRSFDSYFGRYCQGNARSDGAPLACTQGPACCEQMPSSVPGASTCQLIDGDGAAATASYQPDDSPACLRFKMNGGAMDRFAISTPAGACGDPRDFACAAPDDRAGALVTYHRWATTRGALADRFFQSYGFVDGEPPAAGPDPAVQNLIYFVAARFSDDLSRLFTTPLLTEAFSHLQIEWAVYGGPRNLAAMRPFGIPYFYDPHWTPYRSLAAGELEHDIVTGSLPSVAVVLPDADDPLRSEAPGVPFGPGVAFVQALVDQIEGSPYRDDTLVLITHLTAGGHYDHVPPPAPPPTDVDASQGGRSIHFGPRVPFLALGRFARVGEVSHVPLEMSSITRFAEWNWMRDSRLKGVREVTDPRRYRDTFVSNLGSLLDAAQVGAEVPSGAQP